MRDLLQAAIDAWIEEPLVDELRETVADLGAELVCIELEMVLQRRERGRLRTQLRAALRALDRTK